jgi:hypothetical protein
VALLTRVARWTVVCALLAMPSVAAQTPPAAPSLEYRVKAAFIYNFISFTTWPDAAIPAPPAPFRVCLAGADPFGGALDQAMAGESVAGRPVAVVHLGPRDSASACQVLFVGKLEEGRTAADLLRPLAAAPVLSVGESTTFLRDGGIINFVVEQNVRFDVSRRAAEQHGLKLSSKMLRFARQVN